uniref:Myb-like domain-containing protein n=1 Tax=Oryza rufipogon TaxID=4529 RepID=A0A0E0QZP5_ORYRU
MSPLLSIGGPAGAASSSHRGGGGGIVLAGGYGGAAGFWVEVGCGGRAGMDDMLYLGCEGEIQQLLQGPRDETDIYKCLAGESYLLTTKETVTIQTPPNPILNLLDFIPKYGSRCGRRCGGKREPFSLKPLQLETTIFRRHHLRKNNEHWTLKEITELVKGVSKNGVGSWTKLKRDFFSTSIRTAVHLKDKWRNLLKACGIKFTSKRKVAVHALHL